MRVDMTDERWSSLIDAAADNLDMTREELLEELVVCTSASGPTILRTVVPGLNPYPLLICFEEEQIEDFNRWFNKEVNENES